MAEKITFKLNGITRSVEVEADVMLIDVIRENFNLTGTKHGCDNSTCGTCTVLLNGKAVKSCNTAAVKANGAEVITVEGLARGTTLHPVQKAIS
jgi:aerobic-type carbon monoxide dehydrogenase small subunit (CoxS/CutS family)